MSDIGAKRTTDMDEASRRQYLAAMGIQGWVRRLPDDPGQGVVVPGEVAVDEAPEAPRDTMDAPHGISDMPAGGAEIAHPDPDVVAEYFAMATAPPGPSLRHAAERLDWPALKRRVLSCTACGLSETRTQAVFGVGDRDADLLIVGEAPGADEDRLGEPFVGRAGQLLNAMLKGIGLKREQVYIANILKCRPPGNRDPRPEEALCCEPFLMRQIELIKPRVILSVGRISAQNLLKTDAPVGRLRGRIHKLGDRRIPLVVTYHPAYLLRSPEQKAKAWQDLLQVLAILRDGIST